MTYSRIRRIVQWLAFAAFAFLVIRGAGSASGWLASNLFSRLDPLVGASALLASRAFVTFWAASLLTVLGTVVFGRAWCGWVCPLGTLVDVVPRLKRIGWKPPAWLKRGKYVTLAVILIAAAAGTLAPMVLDPITIVTRPLQELARPLVGGDALAQNTSAVISRSAVKGVAYLALVPLVLVLVLSLVDTRLWCSSLCPLGSMLAIISRVPGLRRTVAADACISCRKCAKTCPTHAIDAASGFASDASECVACMSCVDACPTGANAFRLTGFEPTALPFSRERRRAVATLGATGAALAVTLAASTRAEADVLRPPSTDEQRLAQLCVRCGACYSACPTGSLRPSVTIASEAGLWTPMLDERPAHCTLNCNRCASVCPTDALHVLTPAEAALDGVGLRATVNRESCRAWSRNRECMVCQGACPVNGAIKGVDRPPAPDGTRGVTVPEVDTELCVGCDQCAAACVMRVPAIGLHAQDQAAAAPQMPPVIVP